MQCEELQRIPGITVSRAKIALPAIRTFELVIQNRARRMNVGLPPVPAGAGILGRAIVHCVARGIYATWILDKVVARKGGSRPLHLTGHLSALAYAEIHDFDVVARDVGCDRTPANRNR